MKELMDFLHSQRLIVIATEKWCTNLFYCLKENKIYFVSGEDSKHSKQILQNPNIAFSVAWYNKDNHKDRKAVQGVGICRVANDDETIAGVQLHNEFFPEFKDTITVEWIKKNPSHVWVIEPTYIKFWNDEIYGVDGTKEFHF